MKSDKKVKYYKDNFKSIYEIYQQVNTIEKTKNIQSLNFLSIDYKNKKIEFPFYKNHITLRKWINSIIICRQFYSKEKIIKEAFENIGIFIAKYHKISNTSEVTKYNLTEDDPTKSEQPNCFLHGDLTDNNILINKSHEIIIIDWESTPMLNFHFNYGNALWDLVWFANALLRPSPGTYFNTNKRIELVIYFLNGYESLNKFDKDLFITYYKKNIEHLNNKIYRNKNLYNRILLKKHINNWEILGKQLVQTN